MIHWCIHISNVFYLGSFLTRDMLWLRALTCVGLGWGIVFFSCQAEPMYGPTFWQASFLVINLVQIFRLVRQRRRLALPSDQEAFSHKHFDDMDRQELLQLLVHSIDTPPRHSQTIKAAAHEPLSGDEQVMCDIAFSNLSRLELVNLLSRRLWQSMRRKAGRVRRPKNRRRRPKRAQRELAGAR